MTNRQFWMKADQIAESKNVSLVKADMMARLLKEAYDENLNIVIGLGGPNAQAYRSIDPIHPNTIGNRAMFCYTSKRMVSKNEWGYSSVRDILNNLFNKEVIGFLLFNPEHEQYSILVPKEALEEYNPGPHPKPPGFVDVPVSGRPQIPFGI